MLKNLKISNYALIEKSDIDFSSGFSVITGETGAGKSIILGAIGLLLGNRADSKAINKRLDSKKVRAAEKAVLAGGHYKDVRTGGWAGKDDRQPPLLDVPVAGKK